MSIFNVTNKTDMLVTRSIASQTDNDLLRINLKNNTKFIHVEKVVILIDESSDKCKADIVHNIVATPLRRPK